MRDPIWRTAELVAQGLDPEAAAVMIALEDWPEGLVDRWTDKYGGMWIITSELQMYAITLRYAASDGDDFNLVAYQATGAPRFDSEEQALIRLRQTYLDTDWVVPA